MTEFIAFDSRVEVNGQTILSVVDGLSDAKSTALRILSECGLKNIRPDHWYPQQAWLDAFKLISETIGRPSLRSIGRKIPENAEFPPHIKDTKSALQSIDIAYHLNHRIEGNVLYDEATGAVLEGIGHYHFAQTGGQSVEINCENPYPCEFDEGIIKAMGARFRPDSRVPKVRHMDGPCRKEGAENCRYSVEW